MGSLTAIRHLSAAELQAAVDGFAEDYVNDWAWWLTVPAVRRPAVLGKILRRWQATRPHAMRRSRAEAAHAAPFLDDLLAEAASPLAELSDLRLTDIAGRSNSQDRALRAIWETFSRLTIEGRAGCVGITKAVMLASDGRLGPALDSQVRRRLGIAKPPSAGEWIAVLEGVGDDLDAFERREGPISSAVNARFATLQPGRLYDMALGPRKAARNPI